MQNANAECSMEEYKGNSGYRAYSAFCTAFRIGMTPGCRGWPRAGWVAFAGLALTVGLGYCAGTASLTITTCCICKRAISTR